MQRIQSSQPIRDGAVPSSRTGRVWALAFLMSVGVNLPQARAARPMITDDARIVDAGSCQVETWVTRNRNDTEYWALPGCNFTGNLEISIPRIDILAGIHNRLQTRLRAFPADHWAADLTQNVAAGVH